MPGVPASETEISLLFKRCLTIELVSFHYAHEMIYMLF